MTIRSTPLRFAPLQATGELTLVSVVVAVPPLPIGRPHRRQLKTSRRLFVVTATDSVDRVFKVIAGPIGSSAAQVQRSILTEFWPSS